MYMSDDPEYLKMISGEWHDGTKEVFFRLQREAAVRKAALDASPDDFEARAPLMEAFFSGEAVMSYVKPPFFCEYGKHIRLGRFTFVNAGATFLDSAFITFGEHCTIGPNVQFITAEHPLRPEDRFLPAEPGSPIPFKAMNRARPITIGNLVWIGAGAIILPGVTICDGAVVGAGSVVTRDVAARMIVAGNPARVLRSVDD